VSAGAGARARLVVPTSKDKNNARIDFLHDGNDGGKREAGSGKREEGRVKT